MTPMSKLAQRQYRITAGSMALLLTGIGVSSWWCFNLPSLRTQPLVTAAPVQRNHELQPLALPVWHVQLNQPFTDRPKVVAAAPPNHIRLVSVMKREGNYIAAIEAGKDSGLLFLAVGAQQPWGTIQRIEANLVEYSGPSGMVILELTP
jgi:hypothetical protein